MRDALFRALNPAHVQTFSEYARPDLVVALLQADGGALVAMSEAIRGNKTAVLAAVSNYGLALHNASENLKDDKDVVFTAVKNNGMALNAASERLREDDDVVWAAVEQTKWAFAHATGDFRSKLENVVRAVQKGFPFSAVHHDVQIQILNSIESDGESDGESAVGSDGYEASNSSA